MKAKLYEICEELDKLMDSFEIDETTGEILVNVEAIEALNIAKREKIENIGKVMLNLKAEYGALKERKEAYETRMKSVQKQTEKLLAYLDYCLKGEEFKCIDFEIRYRTSKRVEITDNARFLEYASEHPELLSIKTEANKSAIKEAINSGLIIDGAEVVEHTNISIK